ncbi:MAG: DUF4252 domain-containing protein [Bacteroidales bacterium]|nr:DUF4252 domain-containing protein [Bacteroidales bacterium]MDD3893006.1 DUF4252 domain-containing protein [Bacteroidales bacterium]
MQRGFIALFSLLISLAVFSCASEEKETSISIYRDFSQKNNGVFFSVPPGIASILLDDEQKGTEELRQMLSNVNSLSFLIINNSSDSKESLLFADIDTKLHNINFVDLAMVNNGKEIVKIMVQQDGDKVNEMVVLVSNYNAFFCVSFKGTLDIAKIANLAQPENLAAISNLDKFNR